MKYNVRFLASQKINRSELRASLELVLLLMLLGITVSLPDLSNLFGYKSLSGPIASQTQLLSFKVAILVVGVLGIAVIIQQARYRLLEVSRGIENHAALHDPLTGASNRRHFEMQLEQLTTDQAPCHALIMIDLDKFKPVNDLYGHAAGDTLLKEVALGLERIVGKDNLVARLGGDEFVLLLKETEQKSAEKTALSVQDFISKYRLNWHDERISIGTSIGVVNIDQPGLTANTLLAAVDDALYAAKEAGRGAIFSAAIGGAGQSKRVQRIDDAQPEVLSSARSCVPSDGSRQELYASVMAWAPPMEKPGYQKRKGSRRRHEVAYWLNIEPLTLGDERAPSIKMRELISDAAAQSDGGADLARWILTMSLNAASRLSPTTLGRIGFLLPMPARAVTVPDLAEELMRINALAPMPIRHLTFVLHDAGDVQDSQALKRFHARLKASDVSLGFEIHANTLDVLAPMRHVQYDELHLGRELTRDIRDGTIGHASIESLITVAERSGTTLVASGTDSVADMRQLAQMGVSRIAGTAVGQLEPLNDVLARLKSRAQSN